MAISSSASGSQLTVLDTEHTLTTKTDAGTYILIVDFTPLADGDIVILRIKTKCKSGSTSRIAYTATFAHTQVTKNVYSVPIPVDTEIVCTLEQTDGSVRTFDWNLLFI